MEVESGEWECRERKSVLGQTFLLQATLTPTLSRASGRGRIVGCRLENPAPGLAGRASVKPESSDVCSFSSKIRHSLGGGGREKVRMRASLSQKLICARVQSRPNAFAKALVVYQIAPYRRLSHPIAILKIVSRERQGAAGAKAGAVEPTQVVDFHDNSGYFHYLLSQIGPSGQT
jgi:hypothetical protein